MDLNQITLPAADMAESARFYRRMGFLQIVDTSHYARFECPRGTATFSLHLSDAPRSDSGVVIYFECEDVDREVARLSSMGIEFTSQPADQRWLWREARLRDPAGNQLCLFKAGENRKNPPWRVERSDS